MQNFVHNGAICRIRLENFMTYDNTELYPGPNLNMILGPNGTGKSAVVCSIIIGLAGEVTLTGRGSTASDFVKKNRDYAVTEIELYNDDGPNHVIERRIIITNRSDRKIDSKSDWKINSQLCKKSEVQDLMKQLNIKVDNLCQFLPQDSVTQFVKMNTIELLIDTLKAAGDTQLVDGHQILVNNTKFINDLKKELNQLQESRQVNENNAHRLEMQVTQFEQRDQLEKKKEILTRKIIYVRYLERKRIYDEAKSLGRQHQDELKVLKKDLAPTRKALDKYHNEETKSSLSMEKTHQQMEKCCQYIKDYQKEIDNLELLCTEENAEFIQQEQEELKRQNDLTLKRVELSNIERRLEEAQEIDCTEQIKNCQQHITKLQGDTKELNHKNHLIENSLRRVITNLEEANIQHNNVRDIKQKKSQLLSMKYPDAHKMIGWLCDNSNRFSGNVYHPLMIEINVKDPHHSRIVEHAIHRQDFSAFVCEKPEDVTTLTREARLLKAKINVILAPDPSRDKDFAAQRPDYSSLGINTYLKDLIDAPAPILRYLCANNQFHRIPVCTNLSENNHRFLLKKCPKFYNDNSFYSSTVSRYDGQQMIVKEDVREEQHLKFSLDTAKLAQLDRDMKVLREKQTKLQEERRASEQELISVKEEYARVGQKLRALEAKMSEKKSLQNSIIRIKEVISKLEATEIDIESKRAKLLAEIKKCNDKVIVFLSQIVNMCKEFVKCRECYMKDTIINKLASYNFRTTRQRMKRAEDEIKRLESEIEKFEKTMQVHNEALKESRENLKKQIKDSFTDDKLPEIIQAEFDTVSSNDINTLKQLRNDICAQLEDAPKDTGDIRAEFQAQKAQVKDKKKKIQMIEQNIIKAETERDHISGSWRARLNEVIQVIDENYRNFMSKLNYGGQVKLDHRDDDINDFASYGISIMVRYRDNEDLIPLTSTRQSGGERSVATMIYMLALQTKTTVPFRCVDEINQGMDKDNERKVFELLVDTADSSSSQYFLVSPKLLTNLAYSEKMRIHVVYNGKTLKSAWKKSVIEQTGENGTKNDNCPSSKKKIKTRHSTRR